jgi:membrane protein
MRSLVRQMMRRLRDALVQPRHELDRWQRAARFIYDLGRCGLRQLDNDRAPQMAAALSFRTLFGLMPVLVVATVLVKATAGEEVFLGRLSELLALLELEKVQIIPPAGLGAASSSLADWLEDLVRDAMHGVNVAAIGWIGVAVTAYAAISLLVDIENSFNTIYRARSGRPWTRRVPLYWFMLTISPLAILLGIYIRGQIGAWWGTHEGWQWLSTAAGLAGILAAHWLVLFLVYYLFPHTDVQFQPAAAGSLTAALLLMIGEHTLGAYLQNALSLSQLYGSLGLIPLFMFWIYLMWLVVLFGLEVSAILETVRGGQLDRLEPRGELTSLVDPTAIVLLMEIVARNFRAGRPTHLKELADHTALPEPIVHQMVKQLAQADLLHVLADAERCVTLARPAERIPVGQVVEIGFQLTDAAQGKTACSPLTRQLRDVQLQATAGRTLAMLADAFP